MRASEVVRRGGGEQREAQVEKRSSDDVEIGFRRRSSHEPTERASCSRRCPSRKKLEKSGESGARRGRAPPRRSRRPVLLGGAAQSASCGFQSRTVRSMDRAM